jgi:hypothetical protein
VNDEQTARADALIDSNTERQNAVMLGTLMALDFMGEGKRHDAESIKKIMMTLGATKDELEAAVIAATAILFGEDKAQEVAMIRRVDGAFG